MKRNIIKLKHGSVTIERSESKSSSNQSSPEILSHALGLGFSIVVPIVGSMSLGILLDRYFQTAPKLMLGFLFFGVIVSFVTIYRLSKL